jgi:chaperonin GroES
MMFDKLRPLHDRVLIQRIEDSDEKSAGGIIIPEASKEKAQIGTVIATGTGKVMPSGKVIPCQVNIGDKVFFAKYAGIEAGNNQLIMREDEILGVIDDK